MRPGMICGCLTQASPRDVSRYLNHPGVDMVELRLDLLAAGGSPETFDGFIAALAASPRLPVIATNRPEREGGAFKGAEDLRLEILVKAAGAGADWVDLEHDAPEEALAEVRRKGARVLLSSHHFSETPESSTLGRILGKMHARGPDAAKIATFARSPGDCLRVLDLIKVGKEEMGLETVVFCMGPAGRWSRPVSLLLGSPWTYARFPELPSAAPGQLTPEEIRTALRLFQA